MTLRTYFLQEVYEVIDAIEENDILNLKEELGDVLLQVVFHARIAEENGEFSMQDVVDGIANKMVKRHPFVFEKMSKDLFAVIKVEKRKEKKKTGNICFPEYQNACQVCLACIIQRKLVL
ncbi:MAG: MazG nucleotide pyrophosphohydrolase domain-containing protein [Dialister invisus]